MDIGVLAEKTDGCTGADISAICNEAVMNAVRNLVKSGNVPNDDELKSCKIHMSDFLTAMDKIGPEAREKLKQYGN